MKKMGYNFSFIIRFMAAVLSVVVMLHFGVIFYAMDKLSDASFASVSNFLQSSVRDFEKNLQSIQNRMLSEIAYDSSLDKLLVIDLNSVEAISIIRSLKNILMNFSADYPYSLYYEIYFPKRGVFVNDSNTSQEYNAWREMEADVHEIANSGKVASGWKARRLGGRDYLTNFIYNNGRYIICCMDLDGVLKSFESSVYGSSYYFSIADKDGNIYGDTLKLQNDGINLLDEQMANRKPAPWSRYLVAKASAESFGDIYLVMHNFNGTLKIFSGQLFFAILLAVFIGLDIWFLSFVYAGVVKPIETFNKNIRGLKKDELYSVETHYRINELGNASELMAEMVSKIKDLKIDIYEKTLEKQKTEMDFLTLQIEPHFYLNCLNIIYNMCQIGEYDEVQKLCTVVSDYLRYIFKSRKQLVSLKEELEHIRRYLEIQKIRYREGFEISEDIDEDVLWAKIPPLIVQTFVENAIKHTLTRERSIKLFISAKKENSDGRDFVKVVIEDTGEGFDKEILRKLQNSEDISEGERRIGIMNAIARLRFVYGDEGRIKFYNSPSGGAGIEISFPYSEIG